MQSALAMPQTYETEEYADRFIPIGDGLRIHLRDYAPILPETGLPVVCLHGLTRNVKDFELVAPRIAALGRRVVAISMRGRGRSDRDPNPENYQAGVYAGDVTKALDALDIHRAVFIGTSMGGIITMLLAMMAPDYVAAATLNDVGPVLDPAGLTRISGYVGRGQPVPDWNAAAAAAKQLTGHAFPAHANDDAFWLTFAQRTFRETGEGKIEADYDPMIALAFASPEEAPPPDLSPFFQMLAARPVLVLRGALSDLLSREGVAHMRALKPDLFTAEIPATGHAPTLEEPESWNALLDFLARVP
ncbi:MAG: alpha/beta hydrolase [Caulobacterales bacterium]